jgi:hypothetical protein
MPKTIRFHDQRGRAARVGRSEGGGGDGVQVVRAVAVAGVSLVRQLISPDLCAQSP